MRSSSTDVLGTFPYEDGRMSEFNAQPVDMESGNCFSQDFASVFLPDDAHFVWCSFCVISGSGDLKTEHRVWNKAWQIPSSPRTTRALRRRPQPRHAQPKRLLTPTVCVRYGVSAKVTQDLKGWADILEETPAPMPGTGTTSPEMS